MMTDILTNVGCIARTKFVDFAVDLASHDAMIHHIAAMP